MEVKKCYLPLQPLLKQGDVLNKIRDKKLGGFSRQLRAGNPTFKKAGEFEKTFKKLKKSFGRIKRVLTFVAPIKGKQFWRKEREYKEKISLVK